MGDLERIKSLIAEDVAINAKDQDGNTPLHEALRRGGLDAIELLVATGASIDAKKQQRS